MVLPQLDKDVYEAMQELRHLHAATQWEVISAAIVHFAQQPLADRAPALALIRRQDPERSVVVNLS